MNTKQVEQYVIERMEKELSPNLFYHGIFHTRDDVVPAAKRLAELEGIQGDLLDLLVTAAWLHDLGYTVRPLHHELIGAKIAQEILPGFGYAPDQIEAVRWAILATALPQEPNTIIEKILADADLDVLGRDDFILRNQDLRRELAALGRESTDESWYLGQIGFMESHQYFTASARSLRDAMKLDNIAKLKAILQSTAQNEKKDGLK